MLPAVFQPVSFVEWMKAKIPMGDEDAYTYSGIAGFSFGSFLTWWVSKTIIVSWDIPNASEATEVSW